MRKVLILKIASTNILEKVDSLISIVILVKYSMFNCPVCLRSMRRILSVVLDVQEKEILHKKKF